MYSILNTLHDLDYKEFDYENNFIRYFCDEIKKSCRFGCEKQFIMNGRFTITHVQNLLTRYVNGCVL